LGFECRKFPVQPVDTTICCTISIEGWVTDRIKSRIKPVSLEFEPFIPGFPLEMTLTRSNYKARKTEFFRVISIGPDVPDSAFVIPREGIPALQKSEMAFPIQLSGDWFFKENDPELRWTVLKERATGATIKMEDSDPLISDDPLKLAMEIEIESKSRRYKIPQPTVQKVTFQNQKALESRFCYGDPGKINCVLIRKFARHGNICTITVEVADQHFQKTIDSALPILETLDFQKE
ncbi:MAG TPA: hypothetical protein PK228_20450, partial [Saprospiraceae bacterium]|nr:hypothetical protein [Saprospiraceae bacterium]